MVGLELSIKNSSFFLLGLLKPLLSFIWVNWVVFYFIFNDLVLGAFNSKTPLSSYSDCFLNNQLNGINNRFVFYINGVDNMFV